MEIRRLRLEDKAAFRRFQDILLAEKAAGNDLVETKRVEDFEAFLAKSQQNEIDTGNPDWSTSTNFYYFKDGEMLARIGCRWELKGELARVGGHIGYVTRTDFRGQGIMTELLDFALREYAARGIKKVLITARKDNQASRATIEKFPASFDGYAEDRGFEWARYWVDTPSE
ncbi:GNAT family N-acetyltransferase [Streptococcus loxodontisalivarius]|nr:GNAT family N-acetyltransferase [Streptococcus loxodontisalivarius]